MMVALQKHSKLKHCTKNGLGAIKGSDKAKFKLSNTRKPQCSVDIDSCLKSDFPSENRWDYLVVVSDAIEGYFVEVHPAYTSEVLTMIKKKEWLEKEIIEKIFRNIDKNKYKIMWLVTNAGVKILKTSKEYKRLAKENLLPQRVCVI